MDMASWERIECKKIDSPNLDSSSKRMRKGLAESLIICLWWGGAEASQQSLGKNDICVKSDDPYISRTFISDFTQT